MAADVKLKVVPGPIEPVFVTVNATLATSNEHVSIYIDSGGIG